MRPQIRLRRGGNRFGWRPGLVQGEHSRHDAVVCWTVVTRAPRVLGPGRRMRHVLVDPAAGHANDGDPGQDSGCGPNSDAAGQACGPRPSSGGRWSTARSRLRAIVERARRYAEAIREEPGRPRLRKSAHRDHQDRFIVITGIGSS